MAEPSGISHVDERSSSNEKSSGKTGNEKVSGKSGERSSHGKGKQPVKKSSSVGQVSVEGQMTETENKLLSAINSLQNAISKQTEKMSEHDREIIEQNKQLKEFAARLASYEEVDYVGSECYEDQCYDEEYCDEDPSSVRADKLAEKRKASEDENNNSRFKTMAKRFKSTEVCDSPIDELLAENITELFRNGIDDERYNELIKDENNARPSNCEGLCVVQTNPLIWDAINPPARTTDKKMQNIETSVVKASTILSKVVDKMAKMETELGNESFGKLIDECNDVLALLGQTNKQINLARKDFIRPELNRDYSHLCNHNRPFTKLLFGDDVSKTAKEIEDCSKISNRMFSNKMGRGGPMRRRFGRFSRFRGGYGRGTRGRGQSSSYSEPGTSNMGAMAKNFPRRGARPYRQ